MSLDELRSSVKVTEPIVLEETGKLYLYKNFILINDPGKGIHIFDNSDKTSPVPVEYINLPGNYNFSIRNDKLYADSYMDLVVLDISNINDIKEELR